MDTRLYPTVQGGVEVRRFLNENIDKAVQDALSEIPSNTRAVSLDVDFDGEGVRGVVAARLDEHWSVALVGEIKKGRRPVGGARVRFEW